MLGSLILELHGELAAEVVDALRSDPDARTFAFLRVGAQIFGTTYFGDSRGEVELIDAFGQAADTTANGILASRPLDALAFPFSNLPVGVPLGLGVFMYTEASTLLAPRPASSLRSAARRARPSGARSP